MGQIESFCYRIAARTEAAGKYDPNTPREGNEDSFAIIPNVGDVEMSVSFDTITSMPEKGVLLVVADGMGGHNAGEVASQIAVNTVKEMFSAGIVDEMEFSTKTARTKYLEKIVKQANQNIRSDAEANPDRKGMGSTIIMGWIVGNELTVTWCGDSRAYLFRPGEGLELLSEDHSLVQDMVRKKQLTYEETFFHPQGNVITRCLGGGGKGIAEPESRQFLLEPGDIVMLCSDGLSGVLFDDGRLRPNGEPYSDENIQDVMSRRGESLKDTLTCLFDAARRCDWYDNVTAVLFEYMPDSLGQESGSLNSGFVKSPKENKWGFMRRLCDNSKKYILAVVAILVVAGLSVIGLREMGLAEKVLMDTVLAKPEEEDRADSVEEEACNGDVAAKEQTSNAGFTCNENLSTQEERSAYCCSADRAGRTEEAEKQAVQQVGDNGHGTGCGDESSAPGDTLTPILEDEETANDNTPSNDR